MVSVLAFYSDDPSSIPAEVYNFFCKNIVEKNENKQKEAGVGPFLKKNKKNKHHLGTALELVTNSSNLNEYQSNRILGR